MHTTQPQLSFACLIAMALLDSPQKRLTVNEIYDWCMSRFPYFTLPRAGAWKNSVRHNLSLSKHFIKQVCRVSVIRRPVHHACCDQDEGGPRPNRQRCLLAHCTNQP